MPPKNSTRRKLVIATWSAPREGNIYGKLNVDMSEALRYLEEVRARSSQKVTITHLVGVAVARAMAQAPGLNGYLRFGRYHPHDSVDVSFLVALEDGNNLGKALVQDAATKSLLDFARALQSQAEDLRSGKDDDFEKSKGLLRVLPTWLLRPLLWMTGWLSGSLGLDIPAFGVTRFAFGSCIITNVGVFGLDEGWAPPTPFARVPVYILMGAVRDQPVVVDGEVTSRPMMTLCATVDHRFLDGAQGGILARVVRDVLENPWQLDDSEQATEVVEQDDSDILGEALPTVESAELTTPFVKNIPDPGHVPGT